MAQHIEHEQIRFASKHRKISRAKGLTIRRAQLRILQQELEDVQDKIKCLRKQPLPTSETFYVIVNPGMKGYDNAAYALDRHPLCFDWTFNKL